MLSEKELELVNYGLKNGKTPDQIKKALADYRNVSGYKPEQEQVATKPSTFAGTEQRLADVGNQAGQTIKENITGTGQYTGQSSLRRGIQATAAGFSSVPQGALAMAPEPIRKGVDYVASKVGQGFKALTKKIGDTKFMREAAGQVIEDENGIPNYVPNDLGVLEEGLGVAAAGGEIAGNIAGAQGTVTTLTKAGSYANPFVKTLMRQSDDVLAKARQLNVSKPANFISKATTDARYNLSNLDPQVETVLKRSNFDEVNTYFQQAKNAAKDPAKSTPLEIAGAKGEQAFDIIDEARKKAIEGKKTILSQVANERVPGNTLNEVMAAGIKRFEDKFGAKVDAKGNVTQASGRTLTLDSKDAGLVNEYYTKLNRLGISPTVKEVDDFVDWAQSQLYKQSKTMSKLEVASDPVIRELQATTGDLNGRLKATVGNGYGEVNARIGSLIELQDELSRALGADARRGGGLMKTLFSPAGGNTRRIFQQIQDETGIDLFKEATLAKYAMENVGDVRQASLLKKLGVAAEGAAELDLTKPMSVYKWLKERADLDGQELANEFMRRSNLDVQQ
jgi:hypothetical protein